MVILSHAPDGQMIHQLRGRFGAEFGGRRYDPNRLSKLQEKADRVIIVAPYLSRSEKDELGDPKKIIHCRQWGECVEKLREKNGAGTKVGVYPYAFLQMPDTTPKY